MRRTRPAAVMCNYMPLRATADASNGAGLRYVHQQQIRTACQRPLLGPEFAVPVVRIAVHSLPFALASVDRPAGTVVSFIVGDDLTLAWQLTSTPEGWELDHLEEGTPAACEVRTTVDGAIRSFVRDPEAPPFTWQGDQQLAKALSQAKAIIGR